MCLSIPSRVTKVDKKTNSAIVDTMGVTREVSLDLMESGSIKVDDYVLIHIGFIMNKIDEKEALLSLETYKEILEKLDEEELEQAIQDSDNCPSDE